VEPTTALDLARILDHLDRVYETSWSRLFICASVAVGIVGVVVPLLIQWYQARTMRVERGEIRTAIAGQVSQEVQGAVGREKTFLDEKIAAATKGLEERLARDRADLEGGIRKTEAELRTQIAKASGSIFHVQTNMFVGQGTFGAAFGSALSGCSLLVDGNDHHNLRRLLLVMTKRCLPKLAKAYFDKEEDEKRDFESLMEKVMKWDVNRSFGDAVNDAKRAFKDACERPSGEVAAAS